MEDRDSIIRKATDLVTRDFGGDWKKAFEQYAPKNKLDDANIVSS